MPMTSNEPLCDECLNMFKLDKVNEETESFNHHANVESFQQALDMHCGLCMRIWSAYKWKSNLRGDAKVKDAAELCPISYSEFLSHRHPCILFDGPGWNNRHLSLDIVYGDSLEPRGKLSSLSTSSDETVKFIATKLRICKEEHPMCELASYSFSPRRLIDVGMYDAGKVYLRNNPGIVSYATLSHCWGTSGTFSLTSNTAHMLHSGLLIDCLPKTFQEAILVTRKLQIQYIWIDSLCIYQDDDDDWTSEAACMKDIYRCSTLCIAATASKNGNEGLFRTRDPASFRPLSVRVTLPSMRDEVGRYRANSIQSWQGMICFLCPDETEDIDSAPLNGRAWVAQERYLSRRIAHFSRQCLYWECYTSLISEAEPQQSIDHAVSDSAIYKLKRVVANLRGMYSNMKRQGLESKSPSSESHTDLYKAWGKVICYYTKCGMSKEDDVLVAIQGISQDVVVNEMNDRFIAGLCKAEFLLQLCWRIKCYENKPIENQPKCWRAPSWSWASTKCQVEGFGIRFGSTHNLAQILQVKVDAKPSGQLLRASLLLKCKLLPAEISPDATGWSESYFVGYQGQLSWDDPSSHYTPPGHDKVFVLFLRKILLGDKFYALEGIVVVPCRNQNQDPTYSRIYHPPNTPCEGQGEHFRRVGHVRTWFEDGEKMSQLHEEKESEVIELV